MINMWVWLLLLQDSTRSYRFLYRPATESLTTQSILQMHANKAHAAFSTSRVHSAELAGNESLRGTYTFRYAGCKDIKVQKLCVSLARRSHLKSGSSSVYKARLFRSTFEPLPLPAVLSYMISIIRFCKVTFDRHSTTLLDPNSIVRRL